MIKIKGEKRNNDLELYLEGDKGNKSICLLADDNNNNCCWCILKITQNGEIEIYGDLPNDIGLSVNKNGYIKIIKERE